MFKCVFRKLVPTSQDADFGIKVTTIPPTQSLRFVRIAQVDGAALVLTFHRLMRYKRGRPLSY